MSDDPCSKKWPLAVHIILDSGLGKGGQPILFASELSARLSRGERAPRIPVRIWKGKNTEDGFVHPQKIPTEKAVRNLLILLVDEVLFGNRSEWRSYLSSLVRDLSANDLLLPVALQADAARLSEELRDINYFPVEDPTTFSKDERAFQVVLTAILRLLGESPYIFLCHAKNDGEKIAQTLRRYLTEQTQIPCFFDAHDIPHGRPVENSIRDAIGVSCMLVTWTDDLLKSPWCQFEILEARRKQRPMLVLDALTTGVPRFFPFMGNMPIMCWRKKPGPIVSALLLELVRTCHLRAVYENASTDHALSTCFGLHPPDILEVEFARASRNSTSRSSHNIFIYPDPPIHSKEFEFLQSVAGGACFLSLSEWRALRAASALGSNVGHLQRRPNPLARISVGFSVSETETWEDLGLTSEHQEDLAADLAQELILLGARAVWGGDLRKEGLGGRLEAIVETYQQASHASQDHISMVLAWPLYLKYSKKDLQARRKFASLQLLAAPSIAGVNPTEQVASETATGNALWAIGLSLMRIQMAKECRARLLLGGKLRGFLGLYPGIAEEAYETVKAGGALYVIGGFGGAARQVYDAIIHEGRSVGKALVDYPMDADILQKHEQFVNALDRPDLSYDPDAMLATFAQFGATGLSNSNQLSPAENARLAVSQDVYEIMELVVKGLSRLVEVHGTK